MVTFTWQKFLGIVVITIFSNHSWATKIYCATNRHRATAQVFLVPDDRMIPGRSYKVVSEHGVLSLEILEYLPHQEDPISTQNFRPFPPEHVLDQYRVRDLVDGKTKTLNASALVPGLNGANSRDLANYGFVEIPNLESMLSKTSARAREASQLAEVDNLSRRICRSEVVFKTKDDRIVFSLDRLSWRSMTPELQSELRNNLQQMSQTLREMDNEMSNLFGQDIRRHPTRIQLTTGGHAQQAYAMNIPQKIDGIENWLITLPFQVIDTPAGSKIDGLSTSVLLHERAHNWASHLSVDASHRHRLFYDSAFIEAQADIFSSLQSRGDPKIGRGYMGLVTGLRDLKSAEKTIHPQHAPLRVRSYLDAAQGPNLSPHDLSFFYSLPMWNIIRFTRRNGTPARSTGARAIRAPKKLFAIISQQLKNYENSHLEYRRSYWGDSEHNRENGSPISNYDLMNRDTHSVSNIEYFYATLYREAFIEGSRDQSSDPAFSPGERQILQNAYQEAKNTFYINWEQIERIAQVLQKNASGESSIE